MRGSKWIATGAVLAGMAVASGAFAAHALSGQFAKQYAGTPPREVAGVEIPASLKYLEDFKTASEYQMTHALGMIAVGLCLRLSDRKSLWLNLAGWSFLAGILIFSGCLYLLTLTGQRWLGMIVPIGGVAYILGWGFLAAGACSCHHRETPESQ